MLNNIFDVLVVHFYVLFQIENMLTLLLSRTVSTRKHSLRHRSLDHTCSVLLLRLLISSEQGWVLIRVGKIEHLLEAERAVARCRVEGLLMEDGRLALERSLQNGVTFFAEIILGGARYLLLKFLRRLPQHTICMLDSALFNWLQELL